MSKVTIFLDSNKTNFGGLSNLSVVIEQILEHNEMAEDEGFEKRVLRICKAKHLFYGLYKVVLKSESSKEDLKVIAMKLFSSPPISNDFRIKGLR